MVTSIFRGCGGRRVGGLVRRNRALSPSLGPSNSRHRNCPQRERSDWAAVASFVKKSFLIPAEVKRQWVELRPVKRIARPLSDPRDVEERLRWGLARVPKFLGSSDRATLSRLLGAGIRHGASTVPMARLVSICLRGFLKEPGRRGLIAPIIGRLGKSVAENREWVMNEASKSTTPKKLRMIDFLSKAATPAVSSGKIVEKFVTEMEAASRNENHPFTKRSRRPCAKPRAS
ncbi:MAG: uncharacterized membrane-anchored protein YjiN (DUF445 family) [Akkermansiaceae bacterium]|jgi:uncharacterized membrane-anchored protein YjiN (DUF445 family)